MVNYKKVFGRKVKKYRLLKGLSQEKLSELVGLGPKSISPIENGYSFIAIEKLPKLCEALDVPAFELFVDELDENKDALIKTQIFEKLKTCKRSELTNLSNILDVILKK